MAHKQKNNFLVAIYGIGLWVEWFGVWKVGLGFTTADLKVTRKVKKKRQFLFWLMYQIHQPYASMAAKKIISFVFAVIRLTTLVSMNKIQKKCSHRMRLVGLISTKKKEYFFWLSFIHLVFCYSTNHAMSMMPSTYIIYIYNKPVAQINYCMLWNTQPSWYETTGWCNFLTFFPTKTRLFQTICFFFQQNCGFRREERLRLLCMIAYLVLIHQYYNKSLTFYMYRGLNAGYVYS